MNFKIDQSSTDQLELRNLELYKLAPAQNFDISSRKDKISWITCSGMEYLKKKKK